jgi:redox-sensing transcriptional repressor
MDELLDFLRVHAIDVAVLTVPKEAAAAVAKLLCDNGINAIWNFTNVELTEPNSPTIVENIHFSDSLLSLGYYVAERYDEEAAHAARLERMDKAKE